MDSLQGQLLIATPGLLDPNFFRSIVLLVQHNEEGALGLVLNRPLDVAIRTAWEQISDEPCAIDGYLHDGGPCQGPLMVLHPNPDFSEIEVGQSIHFCADRDTIHELVSRNDGPMRFFVGYAGWSPGQLEQELRQGSWLTMPASDELVFAHGEDHWATLFRSLTRSADLSFLNPKVIPEDPSMN